MICLGCDCESFVEKPSVAIQQDYRGVSMTIITTAMTCAKCGRATLNPEQADELIKRTKAKYAALVKMAAFS